MDPNSPSQRIMNFTGCSVSELIAFAKACLADDKKHGLKSGTTIAELAAGIPS